MDNFEEFLRKEAQDFKLTPSQKVWEGVQMAIVKPKRVFVWWYAAASILVLSVASIWYFTTVAPTKTITNNSVPKQQHQETTQNKPEISSNGNSDVNKSNSSSKTIVVSKTGGRKANKFIEHSPSERNVSENIGDQEGEKTELNSPATSKVVVGLLSSRRITISPSWVNYSSSAGLISISTIKSRPQTKHDRIHYTIAGGVNLSNPIKINYNNFVKPSLGYGFIFGARLEFRPSLGVSIGIGYQENSYKLGAVIINPETIYYSTSNGMVAQTAKHKLSNERMNRNFSRQIIVPVAIHFKRNTSASDYFLFSMGLDVSKIASVNYLIKNATSDRLFTNNETLNSFSSYLSVGTAYHHRFNKSLEWLCSYKLQYQTGNTYTETSRLKEHLLVNGIQLGIGF